MALVEDLYNKLSEGGYYTKSLGEFEAQLEDPMYRKKVHNVLTRDGLENTDFETFDVKYTPLKKKEESVSPSMASETSGSLATPEMEMQEPLVSSSLESGKTVTNNVPDTIDADINQLPEVSLSSPAEVTITDKSDGLFKRKKRKEQKEQKSLLTKEEKRAGELVLKDNLDTYNKWQEKRNQELIMSEEFGSLPIDVDYSVLNQGTPRKEIKEVVVTAPQEKKKKFKDKFEEFYYTYMYPMGKTGGMREYFRLLKENQNNPDYKDFIKYAVEEDDIYKDARSVINYELFRKGEGDAQSLLNNALSKYGYTVDQAYAGQDYVRITSPGKQVIELPTNVIGGGKESKRLLDFVYNTWRDEKEYRYIGQKDYEDGEKGLNNYMDDIVDFALTDVNKFKNLVDEDVFQSQLNKRSKNISYSVESLKDDINNFNTLYEDYSSKLSTRNNLVNTYNNELNKYKKSGKKDPAKENELKSYYKKIQDFDKLYNLEDQLKKIQNEQSYIKDKRSLVDREVKSLDKMSSVLAQSLPLQQAEKEKQGNFLGFIGAKISGGILDAAQAAAYLTSDIMTPILGSIYGGENIMPKDEYEKLKEQGLSDFEVFDKASKQLKRTITKDLNNVGEIYFDTTKEYQQSEDRTTFEKVLGSVLESVGAAAAAPKGLGFYAQSYANMEEMMLDPAFDGISEMEKKLISVPYAIAIGALERFGFNVLSGSNKSLTNKLIIDTIGRSMAKLPKNASIDAIKHEINKDLSSMLVTGGLDYFLSSGAEGVVEGTQSLTETGVKSLVNAIYEKELFQDVPDITTYDGLVKAIGQAGEETYMGTLGGLMFATVTNSYNIIKERKFNKQSNELFDQYEKLLKDGTTLKSVENLIKIEVDKGSITEAEALDVLRSVKECQEIINTIPNNLSTEDKRRSFDYLLEKKGLEQEIAGKDEALITGQRERIEQINNDLKIISKNAIKESTEQQQEGTAEGGVVQREGVDQGQPQAGQGEGTVGQATQQETNISDSNIPGSGIQETEVVTEQPIAEEVVIDKPTIATNSSQELERVKTATPEAEDGSTFNLDGTVYDGVGLVVPVVSVNTTVEEATPEMIADFVEQHADKIGDNETVKVGIYKFPNSNEMSIDLNVVAPESSREQAIEFGRLADQESLFDLGSFQNVKTGGTGKNPMQFSGDQFKEIAKALKEGRLPNVFEQATPSQSSMGTVISGTDVEIETRAAQISKPRMTKIVANAAKAVSRILPNTKFIVHDTQDSFTASTGETDAGGYFDPATGEIHINLEQANARTVAHEVFHAVLLNAVKTDANAAVTTRRMIEAVSKKIDSNPQLKQYLDDFASNYEDNIQNEEKVSELVGVLAENYETSPESIKDVIKRWLDRIAKAFGLNPFNRNEVYDVLNTVARKTAKGKTIKEKDIVLITKETPGSDSFIGSFNIPRKSKGKKAPSVKNDPRDFIRKFVQDLDIREFNGQNFVTNMYDYTNAGITDLGNGFSINTLGGKNYVPLMMSLKNLNIGDVSNIAAFNTKAQAETFIRNSKMGNANLFAPHAGTLDQSWQFQQHTFAELFNLVLDNGILKPKELIATFNNVIKNNKENQAQFKQFAERYGKNIKNFNSFISDPKKIIDLLDINNNYSPKLRKALNSAIASNKKFKQAIGANNLNEFYKRIMDPLNDGVVGGEIMNVVDFDPNTFEIVQTNPNDIDHHPSFGWTLLAKINGIYQPTEFHKSSDITDTYTKYNISGEETSVKIEEPKFEQKNVSSSAGAIPKVAKFNVSPRKQIIGKNAKLSQNVRNNLQVARDMEKDNKSVRDIRIATGWERGFDKKWRYEIDDNILILKSRLLNELNNIKKPEKYGELSRIDINKIINDELIKLYPELSNTEIVINPTISYGEGYYIPSLNQIHISNNNLYLNNTASILLHEIQHVIQNIEGFSVGSDINRVTDSVGEKLINEIESGDDAIIYNKLQSIISKIKENPLNRKKVESGMSKIQELLDNYSNKKYGKTVNASAFDVYRRYAGEVEARNVEKRMKMTPDERKETTLQETEDVSREDQIIFFNQPAPRRQKKRREDLASFQIMEESKKYMDEKTKRTTAKDLNRKYLREFEDRQVDIKKALLGIGNKYSQRAYDVLVSKAGASGWANERFKEADKKIFGGLRSKSIQDLNSIIYNLRIIAINENRAERGMKPYTGMDVKVIENGKEVVKPFSSDIAKSDLEDLKQLIGEKQFKKLEARAKEYFKVFNENLLISYESGRITKEVYESLRDIDYSPIRTIKYMIGESLKNTEQQDKMSRILGLSIDDIKSLGDENKNAIVNDARWLMMMGINASAFKSFENRLFNAIDDAYINATDKQKEIFNEFYLDNPVVGKKDDGTPIFKYDKESIPEGFSKITFYKNGIKKKMVIEDRMASQLYDVRDIKQAAKDEFVKNVGKFTLANLLRFRATGGNPLFIVRNAPMDLMNVLFFSDVYGKMPLVGKYVAAPRVAFDFVKNFLKSTAGGRFNEIKKEFLKYGGGMDYMATDGIRMFNSRYRRIKKDFDVAREPIYLALRLSSFLGEKSEEAFRLSVYEKTKNDLIKKYKKDNDGKAPEGQDLEDILFASVREAREIVDFNQGGNLTKRYDAFLPYLNVGFQSFKRAKQFAIKSPVRFADSMIQMTILGGSIMAASLSAFIRGACGDELTEEECNQKLLDAVNSVPEYVRANNFIFFTGDKDEEGNWEYYKLAKLPILAVAATFGEQTMIRYFLGSRGVDYDPSGEIMKQTWKSAMPFDPEGLASKNPLIAASIAYGFNYDTFRKTEIFKKPKQFQNMQITAKYEGKNDDNVNNFFKYIADTYTFLGYEISPIRLQAAVEKFITSETTNPTTSLLYATANGLFVPGTDTGEAFSEAIDAFKKNVGKKFVGYTSKSVLENQDKKATKEERELIGSDIYDKTTKMWEKIDNIYDSGKTLSMGELYNMVVEDFGTIEAESYFNKFNSYIANRDTDKRLLNIVYERNPRLQALYIYQRYGSSIEKDEIIELNKISARTGSKISQKAMIIYNEEYLNK